MVNISSGINMDSSFINLKEIDKKQVREEVHKLMIEKEDIIYAFQTIRD